MQEQVSEKIISLSIQTAEGAGSALREAVRLYINRHQNGENLLDKVKLPELERNKVKVSDLVHLGGISKADVMDEDLRAFERVAKKYQVKYAVEKNKDEKNPGYTFFFQSKDSVVLDKAMAEFIAKKERDANRKKESVEKRLNNAKDKVKANAIKKDKTKAKEQVR